jgi:hypothetical protein
VREAKSEVRSQIAEVNPGFKLLQSDFLLLQSVSDFCNSMTFKQRERMFYVGAPLAIAPALAFLPAVMFLVVVPRVAHAQVFAWVLLPPLVASGGLGLWKLALGAVQQPFTLLNALSVGCLLVVLVIAGYTGLFLALITSKL